MFFFVCFPSSDEFEAKFVFHPIEELPPPDDYKPFSKVYPSKSNKGTSPAAAQSGFDERNRMNLKLRPLTWSPAVSALLSTVLLNQVSPPSEHTWSR